MHAIEPINRDAVLDLLTAYVQVVDDPRRLFEWPDYFAQEAAYRIYTRENWQLNLPIAIMLDDTKGKIRDRIFIIEELWRDHFDEQTVRHILSLPHISCAGELLDVSTNFTVFIMKAGRGPYLFSGVYYDKLCVEDGRLKFKDRTVVLDNSALPTYFVYPL